MKRCPYLSRRNYSLSARRDDELPARSICEAQLDATLRHGTNVDAEGNITMPSPLWVPEELMSDNKRAAYTRTKNSLLKTARDPDRLSKCADTRGRCIGGYGSGANCTQSDPIEVTNDILRDPASEIVEEAALSNTGPLKDQGVSAIDGSAAVANDLSLDEGDDDLNSYVAFARRSLQRMKATMVLMKKPPYQMRFF